MLDARKNGFLNTLLYQTLILSAVRQNFHSVFYRQDSAAPDHNKQPVILFCNHSSWWDAHMAMILNEELWHRDGYVMVEDTQLSRYQFFRYMGAFSVSRTNARSAIASLKYASNLLKCKTNSLMLIFPQGELQANDLRPLNLFKGAGAIACECAPCLAYPLALRYEFVGEQKPHAFISVGLPISVSSTKTTTKEVTQLMTQRLTEQVDQLRDDVIARQFTGFKTLVHGQWSINRIWDTVRRRKQIRFLGPG